VNFFEKNKGVRFTFELENGQSLQLEYCLQPNSLREKWISEVKSYLKEPNTYLNLKISNKNYLHLDELKEKINSIVNEINTAYEYEILVPLNRTKDINRTKLNNLHEKFEEYGEYGAGDGGGPWYRGQRVHDLWLDLNEWIHITETAMETNSEDYPNYSALVTVYPPYPGKKLEEKDKLFLTTDFSWGHLYLGYNTLGKDYMHVTFDDDVRVIANDQVKVQNMYSSEAWLCFQEKQYFLNETQSQFYRWHKTLKKETQEMIPIENLNKLALGRYYLGCISINEDLLKFHPIQQDWYSNADLQKRWNNEVFSKIKNVTRIEIHE
jgi:hypothetical protein